MHIRRRTLFFIGTVSFTFLLLLLSSYRSSHTFSQWLNRLANCWDPPSLIITWVSDSTKPGRITEFDMAMENRARYCGLHPDIRCIYQDWKSFRSSKGLPEDEANKRHIVWYKWAALREMMWLYPRTEWVGWLDEDILITNPNIHLAKDVLQDKKLQELLRTGVRVHPEHLNDFVYSDQRFPKMQKASDINLVITIDGNAINAGAFFIRNRAWSRSLLHRLDDPWLEGQPWPLRENQALIYVIEHDPHVLAQTGIVAQRSFNSYREGPDWMQWQPGDFAIHLVACHWNGNCKELYDEWYWRRLHGKEPPEDYL